MCIRPLHVPPDPFGGQDTSWTRSISGGRLPSLRCFAPSALVDDRETAITNMKPRDHRSLTYGDPENHAPT